MSKQNPTLADVAKIAGVSQMTASRALNDRRDVSPETRDLVLRVASDIGYVANRSAQKLSGARNGIIGIITPMLDNQFASELILGVGRAARAVGYETLVYTIFDEDRHTHRSLISMLQQFADGVVAILPRDSAYSEALVAAHVPVVSIDQRGSLSNFPSISVDSYGGAVLAVEHLANLGHQRIAFISGDELIEGVKDRRRAYSDTVERLGLANDPELIEAGDLSQLKAFEAASRLLSLPNPPTAIFAANDLSAFGVIAAVREAGLRVPNDVSVIGFDDIPMAAQVHPPLTTIRQPFQQMARTAVSTLLASIKGTEDSTVRMTAPAELVVRDSTGRPPEALKKRGRRHVNRTQEEWPQI
ncbi:LacI family DNA-binding transcriptional regulator [Paraburkholderia sp. HP33-1]|uniref:LacI family DNA-binding transcriptional regulator n=1 Tax=Paraburkholderia sp. HP33-1 TaxID=2883243 RepID=UPI001F3A582A|nr:LacI family DNA-binding transcriptional regulator [Paraburkholderia sp. HP33-1]